MLLATTLCEDLGRWLLIFPAVTAVLVLKARTEEKELLSRFGRRYVRYRERVPRLLPIPKGRTR